MGRYVVYYKLIGSDEKMLQFATQEAIDDQTILARIVENECPDDKRKLESFFSDMNSQGSSLHDIKLYWSIESVQWTPDETNLMRSI